MDRLKSLKRKHNIIKAIIYKKVCHNCKAVSKSTNHNQNCGLAFLECSTNDRSICLRLKFYCA